MSAIENNPARQPSTNKRLNKKSTRVDLTPMVDLGFLLITFFVFTTTLSQPTVMNLNMPYDKVAPNDPIPESRVLTLLLQQDNTIQYYEGMAGSDQVARKTTFSPDGIRGVILKKKKEVMNLRGEELVLIIKSADGSNFQNFVDILDEVTINNVKHYYIDELSDADKKLVAQK